MTHELTPAEIEAKFNKINARPAEEPDEIDKAMLSEAEAVNDDSTVSCDEFMHNLDDYSGKLVLRIPRSLHKELKEQAAIEGVSLNQYMLYKLSR